MELFWHDVLHAARALIKHRGYSAFAILTLGLGIGANVGMFSVFGWLLSPKLSVPRSFELVEIDRQSTSMQASGRGLSWSMYREYVNAQPNALPELAAYYPALNFEIGDGNKTVSAAVTAVTGNYFGQLQVQAFRGRVINEQDDSPNGEGDVVVLSHRCWRELFGGRDGALGTELRVNGTAYTIIGVAPPTFTGIDPEHSPDIWIPLSRVSRAPLFRKMMLDETSNVFRVFGRMKQGASVFQAREQMKGIAGQLGSGKSQMAGLRHIGNRTVPYYWEKPWPDIQLIDGHRQEEAHKFSLVVFGIVGSILILVAANITTILLARTERQCREFAIRVALGASRWRIARGILVESFIVSALGTVVGLIFASLFIRLMVGLSPENTRWHETLATGVFDGRVLVFGFGIAALVAGGFSLAPMMRAGSSNPRLAMQMTAATGTSGRTSTTFRNVLTVFQTAASFVLLAFTLLLLQSVWNRSGAVFNFDTQSVSVIYWNLPGMPSGSDAEKSFQNAFVERVKHLPGVQAAALCNPCRVGRSFSDVPPDWYDSAGITPEYFGVTNTPILEGRNFTNQDGKGAPLVGIINLKMARQLWPKEDPIGKRLEHSRWDDSTVEIVGVVADTRKEGRGEPENAILYRPLDQASTDAITTFPVIRTDGRSLNLSALQTAAREITGNVTISKMQTVADILADNTRDLRLEALAVVAFAMIAVTLTVVGLYGLLSYIASAQTRDLGVRLALGAPRTSVLLLMLRSGVVPALIGVAIGVAAEAACPDIFSGDLYGVGMHDIPTLGFVALTMFCVGVAASWIPSWRASRLNPNEALRQE